MNQSPSLFHFRILNIILCLPLVFRPEPLPKPLGFHPEPVPRSFSFLQEPHNAFSVLTKPLETLRILGASVLNDVVQEPTVFTKHKLSKPCSFYLETLLSKLEYFEPLFFYVESSVYIYKQSLNPRVYLEDFTSPQNCHCF